ncbi:MAG: Holliday junction resolvase RuvX [Patescibacteria group bacterium]
MKILAIDYGEKRTGLAIGDSSGKLAVPFGVLKESRVELLIEKIKKIIKEEEIDHLLVGEPKSLTGGQSSQTIKVQNFVKQLRAQLNIKVITLDERFTTKRALGPSVAPTRQRDELAAMYLLQDYLDSLNLV